MSMDSLVHVHVLVLLAVLSNSKPSPEAPVKIAMSPPFEVADQLFPTRDDELVEIGVSSSKFSVHIVVWPCNSEGIKDNAAPRRSQEKKKQKKPECWQYWFITINLVAER